MKMIAIMPVKTMLSMQNFVSRMHPLSATFSRYCRKAAVAAFIGLMAMVQPARSELMIDVGSAGIKPTPIVIADFSGDAELGKQVSGVIANDLTRSGYFTVVDKNRIGERASFEAAPNFNAWKNSGAQAILVGRISRDGSGRLKAEFRLWDIFSGQQLAGQQYQTDPNYWRRVGHLIADSVYSKITGISGFFDTRVAFVSETGPKENRVKRLAVMDQDGANIRYITQGDSNVSTPRYSLTTQDITFMTQKYGDQGRVQVINLETGARQAIGNFPQMTTSPRFSPDGQRVVLSMQQTGNANIYMVDLGSHATTRLTTTNAIDTSPSFSPDGKRIVFESDRGGKQQLYVMNTDGSNQQRISFGEGSYAQPAWSPRGDFIAFTKIRSGGFAIGIMKTDGSGERVLTESFHSEGPTWSPNGQYIIFYRDPGGQAGGRLYMVDVTGRVELPVPTPTAASDPTWSPLLSKAR